MGTRNIYIRKNFEATYKSFLKVCEREGESASTKIRNWIQEYMAAHGEGNPQTLLKYAGKPKTLPLWKTCRWSQGLLINGQFYCQPGGSNPYWRIPKACEHCSHYREKDGSK